MSISTNLEQVALQQAEHENAALQQTGSKQTRLEALIKSPTLVNQETTPPVIVVGLPRSGSSYLAHVLSCLEGWFIFDDLYPYQKAATVGLSSAYDLSQDSEGLKKFVNQLSWQLWAKIKYEENFQVPDLSLEDPFEMEAALLTAIQTAGPMTWPQVLEEWMMRLTLYGKKRRWGYKTPQDFMHMDELATIFPGAKFIYILRDPRKMMRSFKNLPRVKTNGNQDGESRQYHPAVYSLYWKNAYEKVQAFQKKGSAPVEVVKFEDLVRSPQAVAERLAQFLDTQVSGDVTAEKSNSSIKHGAPKELTNTEVAICEKIAGTAMRSAGYSLHAPTPRPFDIIDLIKTSVNFTHYQLERIATNKKARTSIIAFIKSIFQ